MVDVWVSMVEVPTDIVDERKLLKKDSNFPSLGAKY